jgi:NADH dehydrogenase
MLLVRLNAHPASLARLDAIGQSLAFINLGRIIVEPTLQLSAYPEAFVIGDAAEVETDGQPLPMLAPVAVQQAETATTNIQRLLAGQPRTTFKYKDLGTLTTIGRNAAVAAFGQIHFRGFIAWVLWLGIHILLLIGFRNR